MVHRLYKYNRMRGSKVIPCAGCTCGAEMIGQDEIDSHLQEVE